MAGTSYDDGDDVSAGKRRWESLVLVTELVFEGKVELEELVRQYALDRSRILKNKRDIPKKEKSLREELVELISKHIINNNNNNNVRDLQLSILPEALKSKIVEIGGDLESVALIIEKNLTATDVSQAHCRLSVPVKKVSERFLLSDEVGVLMAEDGQPIETVLIQPSLEKCNVDFSIWKSIKLYVLKKGWYSVCLNNGLKEGNVIRLWGYRRSNSDLCFALELVH